MQMKVNSPMAMPQRPMARIILCSGARAEVWPPEVSLLQFWRGHSSRKIISGNKQKLSHWYRNLLDKSSKRHGPCLATPAQGSAKKYWQAHCTGAWQAQIISSTLPQ